MQSAAAGLRATITPGPSGAGYDRGQMIVRYRRTVTLRATVTVTVFAQPGLTMEALTLSDRRGQLSFESGMAFATVGH